VAAKEIPSQMVYEDALVVAFNDIGPQAPVHVLVIPRKHISTNLDLTPDDNALVGHMYQVANEIAKERGIAENGFRLVMNSGADAGQAVFHIHLHVLGGRKMNWPPG
jgi:histidine triad (HIT) family protein